MLLTKEERAELIVRISRGVIVDEGYGCWLWHGLKNEGYAAMGFRGKWYNAAHRLSYAAFNRDFDDCLYILHKCDVSHCVNPDHLFLGTQKDNMGDAAQKGRIAHNSGKKNGQYGKDHSGEKNGMYGKGYLQIGEKNPMFGKRGKLSPLFGRKHSEKTLQKMREKARQRNQPSTR